MGLMTRLSNGWTIAINSFKVLRENKQLIIFPILSGISLILIMASFFTAVLGFSGWDINNIKENDRVVSYAILLAFYTVNYFVVVFFNMALIHCTSLYFKGEEVNVRDGIKFSMSRIGSIFAWAVFAGTVGTILRVIQENIGTLGKIITGIVGIVWSVATFFVVPIIAYENLGPIDAFKKSSKMIKEKWGEGIGAGFSFGLINLVSVIVIVAVSFGIGYAFHPIAGIAFGLLCIMLLHAILSAARTIFISQVYHGITGDPVEHFNQQMIDNLFVSKKL